MLSLSLQDLRISSEELKEIAKLFARKRGIKGYDSMPKNKLISALKASESKNETRIEKIKKEFNESRHKFSKSKINEIRTNLYEIGNKKNLFESKLKEIEKSFDELEKNLSETKKYYDYDDVEYRGIKDMRGLFDLSADRDYYKPVIINGAFSNNNIQHESKGNNDKIVTVDKYLDIIRPYLRDIINDHKIKSEWKIQLTIAINFISSKADSSETRIMHAKSDNVEIMIRSNTDEIVEELFRSRLQRNQEGLEESMKGSLFVFDGVNALCYDFNKINRK